MNTVPRMRTIQQCSAYLKEKDPEGCIGEWRIRQMVKQKEIPVYQAGRRNLINLDVLIEFLSGMNGGQAQKEDA